MDAHPGSETATLISTLEQEEKRFLIQQYGAMLLAQLENHKSSDLDDATREALRVVQRYATPSLDRQIKRLLPDCGTKAAGNHALIDAATGGAVDGRESLFTDPLLDADNGEGLFDSKAQEDEETEPLITPDMYSSGRPQAEDIPACTFAPGHEVMKGPQLPSGDRSVDQADRTNPPPVTLRPAEGDSSARLDQVTCAVSVDDLERCLEIRVTPEDRERLNRRLQHKLRDSSLRLMLNQIQDSGLSWAMVPRIPRFLRAGSEAHTTVANLVRCYPQLFDNVHQFILRYRSEPFFQHERARLDWAFVSTEALPQSLGLNYTQQLQVLQQYAVHFPAGELQVTRRRLVEALWDLIAVQTVLHQTMLRRTVELTESRVGRQNLVYINCGDQGFRINDMSRQDTHDQIGVCPCW